MQKNAASDVDALLRHHRDQTDDSSTALRNEMPRKVALRYDSFRRHCEERYLIFFFQRDVLFRLFETLNVPFPTLRVFVAVRLGGPSVVFRNLVREIVLNGPQS